MSVTGQQRHLSIAAIQRVLTSPLTEVSTNLLDLHVIGRR
jgi:hypothetical protein